MAWIKFDHEDESTWPPDLVDVLRFSLWHYQVAAWDPGEEEWFIDNDLDDGFDPDVDCWWQSLPAAPESGD